MASKGVKDTSADSKKVKKSQSAPLGDNKVLLVEEKPGKVSSCSSEKNDGPAMASIDYAKLGEFVNARLQAFNNDKAGCSYTILKLPGKAVKPGKR